MRRYNRGDEVTFVLGHDTFHGKIEETDHPTSDGMISRYLIEFAGKHGMEMVYVYSDLIMDDTKRISCYVDAMEQI